MRIAFISYEFPPDTGKGGIGTYVNQIAKALAALDWDIHVFAGSNERSGSEYSEGYNVHRLQCKDGNEFRNKVVSEFELQHKVSAFDLMESPEINGNAWEIKKKYPGIPLVVRLHAPNYLVESLKKKYIPFLAKIRFVAGSIKRIKFDLGYWRRYDKLIDADFQFIQLANYITSPSEAMKKWVVEIWQIPSNKITFIPNIFSPPEALLNIPVFEETKYKRILFFGRLNVLKGLVNATMATRLILKKFPDWKFRVIGDDGPGPSKDISMRNWMKLQLKDVITQIEFMDGMDYQELPNAISECEIILLPSLFESFSYTCAEAMSAGKAVVGSNNAGMAHLIENNNSGILINPYNYHDIYASSEKLIENNSFRYELSLKARERILNDFEPKKTALEFSAFYKRILDKQFAKN